MTSDLEFAVAKIASIAGKTNAEARLVPLLRDSAPIYRGLSSSQAEWLRAQVYALLAQIECGSETRRFAIEDLRTSYDPTLLSGIARCLTEQETIDPAWEPVVRMARQRIALCDVYPDFRISSRRGCCSKPKTALGEIDALLERLTDIGSRSGPDRLNEFNSAEFSLCPTLTAAIAFRDQDNRRASFAELCSNTPVIIAFFYTRCMNPQKCSLTISRLGETARRMSAQGAGIGCFGITYDPRFDTSPRLAAYGSDRGFPFSDRARLLRCISGWPVLRRLFELHVGFGGSVVNRHSREVFVVLDGKSAIRREPEDLADSEKWESVNRHAMLALTHS